MSFKLFFNYILNKKSHFFSSKLFRNFVLQIKIKRIMKNINYKNTISNIRKSLKNYLVENKLKSMVLGVSGGADSALVCALAYPVAKELGIELIGRSISIETNKEDEQERARNIGKYFCTNFDEIDLTDEFYSVKNYVSRDYTDQIVQIKETEREKKIRLGNVKARMRMIYIYDLAQKNKGFVLSTDNYTELMIGFWTIAGDIGDYGMIQELWKTEVYKMIEYIADNENITLEASNALKSMLDAVATDGLGITNSDLDQLLPDWKERHTTTRQGYGEVDAILENYLFNGVNKDTLVIKRHLATEFKRNNPLNLKRKDIVEYF
jgi:NAD+ synthase